ncbi:hypothetical protein F5050DRAFT_1548201, partial [Lentinula boryana]
FGTFKKCFQVTTQLPEYPIQTQAKFVVALGVLFNFMRMWDPSDIEDHGPWYDEDAIMVSATTFEQDEVEHSPSSSDISTSETICATCCRDRIAQRMWNDYCVYL